MPLNGDLRNQGLTNWNPTLQANTTATYTNGKLGQALNTGGIIMPASVTKQVLNNQRFSYTCWIYPKISSNPSTERAMIFGNDSPRQFSMFQYPTGNDFHWSWYNTYNGEYIYCAGGVLSGMLPSNTWTHIAVSYNNPNGYIYINGELKSSFTGTVNNDSYEFDTQLIYNSPYHLLNDVRIYDHALSPREVKEISKGLVLHYTLSDPFIEETTNLITTEDCLSSICYNGATSKYGYGANSDMYKTVTTFDGKKGTKVYMGTNGNSAYPYVYIDNMYTSNGTNAPTYKTLSFDYYTNISTSICPYKLGGGSGTATYKVINDTVKTGTGTNSVVIPVKPNTWNHIEVTFHGTTDANAEWGYIENQPSHVSNTSNFWFFANMQLETKDHATGYAKYGTSRSETIVYDVSGYGNNGIINGALVNSNNTPKYRFSTIFDGNTASIKIPFNDMVKDRNYTISVWTYKSQIGTKSYQTILGGPSGFELEARNANNTSPLFKIYNWGGGTTPYEFNKWYHFCFVHTDTDSKLYINGELKVTGTSVDVPTGNYFIGAWQVATSQNYDGLMSDFRIYTTPLSADDVLALYNTPISLTSTGVLMTSGELTGA